MLGACTNEDVIDNGGQTVLPGEKGYISLGINLPTTPSSRAANDNFGDGTSDEYAVDDATLIVLEGTSEDAATVTGVYTLTLMGRRTKRFFNSEDENGGSRLLIGSYGRMTETA